MAQTQIMNPTTVCNNFPRLRSSLVSRDNILDTIDVIFEGGTNIVVFEGEEGIGKTTLLAQFALNHADTSLSLFVKAGNRLDYQPDILRYDLCNQLEWLLFKRELPPQSEVIVDDGYWRNKITELKRRTHWRESFYFIVDGLDEIPEEEAQTRELILDMFSFEQVGFYFIFTGDPNNLFINRRIKPSYKSQYLSGFTLDETKKYLEDVTDDEECIEEIRRVCRGVPGYLEIVRHRLSSGADCQAFLEEMPMKLPELFELEWHKAKIDDERLQKILAIMSIDRNRHSIDDLERILSMDATEIQNLLKNLVFIVVNESKEVNFTSEAFRKFVSKKLANLEETVNNLLIEDLYKTPNDVIALTYLPDYLEQARRFDKLLDYLSLDRFTLMIERNQSLSPVLQKTDLGIHAAQQLHRDGDLLRFCIQKSAVIGLSGVGILRSEIEALMALNNYDAALALAQSTVLKEDRLNLLAIVAKAKREQKQSLEPELIDQIRQLYDEIDLATIGKHAIEIAMNLIHSCPDLAIRLVEETTKTDDDENALDWTFALMTLSVDTGQAQNPDTLESIRSRIKDPAARQFSNTVSLLFDEYSVNEVIEAAEKFDNPGDSLFLLRLWLIENRKREDAVQAVDFALKLAIKVTSYTPNARVFREIAAPLPFVLDIHLLETLVGRFDSQLGTLEHIGPIKDCIRLKLFLAEAVYKYSANKACDRIIDVYLYVCYLEDIAIKTECMARLIATLTFIDPEKKFEKEDGLELHTLIEQEFTNGIDQILITTANHYNVTKEIIKILAPVRRDIALTLANKLNTEHHRQHALLNIVKSVSQIGRKKLDLPFIESSIGNFTNHEFKDEALIEILIRLARISIQQETLTVQALPLIGRIKDIEEAGGRCLACCCAYSFLVQQDPEKYKGLMKNLLDQLRTSWECIDVEWHKINVGFRVTKMLATCTPDRAKEYLDLTDEFRSEIALDSRLRGEMYSSCLQLSLRAYKGLFLKNLDKINTNGIEELAQLIDRIASSGVRAECWAELALNYYSFSRHSDCKRIVNERIKPLLENINPSDRNYQNHVIVTIAPALYCAHPITARERLSQLTPSLRDKAYENICEFIFRKQLPSDPYYPSAKKGYNVHIDEIVDICEIMESIESDKIIFALVEDIVNSMVSNKHKHRFLPRERTDIVHRLEKIVHDKLPNAHYITHDGFKTAALSHIARLYQTSSQTWLDLKNDALRIPNVADRIFVLLTVANAMPTKEDQKRKECLHCAKEVIGQVADLLERVALYEQIAEVALSMDGPLSKECLKLGMQATTTSQDLSVYTVQQRIIESAYNMYDRYDDPFVKSLINLVTNNFSKMRLEQRIDFLKAQSNLINSASSKKTFQDLSLAEYPQTASTLLAWLNADENNRHFQIDALRSFIHEAAGIPLSQAYPILTLVVENMVRAYSATDQARTHIQPIYDALLLGTELTGRLAIRSLEQLQRTRSYAATTLSDTSMLVRPNPRGSNIEREAALQSLKNWATDNIQDYLIICDQYFGTDDLDILLKLGSVNQDCKVVILTSKKHQGKIAESWDAAAAAAAYRAYWHEYISPIQAPPDTDIIIVGVGREGKSPIHDRWWLTKGGGLRIGTSASGLAKSISEISLMKPEEALERENIIQPYLTGMKREHQGEKLSRVVFTL